jgi:predicted Zn-dependent protease with MMP-like domain
MSPRRLTLDEFCKIVGEVLDELPDEFRERLENVVVDVQQRPSRQLLAGLVDHDPGEPLLGLFQGAPITEQEFGQHLPNRIFLFKQPIEDVCRSREEIAYEIRRTVLHELAHHFGYSEEDLDFFEDQPSPFDEEED